MVLRSGIVIIATIFEFRLFHECHLPVMPPPQDPADFAQVPVIDLGPLVKGTSGRRDVAEQLGMACRECGFFYVVGHGVDEPLCARLEDLSRQFFAWSTPAKMRIGMSQGGRAWRGYFSVGDELRQAGPIKRRASTSAPSWPTIIRRCWLARPFTAEISFPIFLRSARSCSSILRP